MSKYTTQLRFICESESGLRDSVGFDSITYAIENSHKKIFNFDYPIFDENYRDILEKKILNYYYTREICCETVGLWRHYLDIRMNEVMPYFNQLYKSQLLEFNPFYDVDYTRTISKKDDGQINSNDVTTSIQNSSRDNSNKENGNGNVLDSSSSTVNNTKDSTTDKKGTDTMTGSITEATNTNSVRSDNTNSRSTDSGSDTTSSTDATKNDRWDYYSDTPQGTVSDLANLTYLTNARHITDDGTGSTSSSTTNYGKINNTANTGTIEVNGSDNNVKGYDTVNETHDVIHDNVSANENATNTNEKRYDNTLEKTGKEEIKSSEESSNSLSKTINNVQDYLETVKGKMPGVNYSRLLEEYRTTFLNIDKMVIDSLADLFFTLW